MATSSSGTRRLVIVESPAKAKTIQRYLGPEYVVEASVGHIRDLPRNAKEVPEKYRKEPWASWGVDVDHGFTRIYVVDARKKQKVSELKALLKEADELLLATDEDREGEAIAWHLLEVLKPKVPVKRMVFHEITPDAIRRAAEETRDLDQHLVDAQETRRVADRLYGYELSPVLWKKVMGGLSAGRVQSVATRLIVDRERERIAFRSAAYWDIAAVFEPGAFAATLVAVDGTRVATGRDFGADGALTGAAVVLDETSAASLVEALAGVPFEVTSVDDKPYSRSPAAPFMTSTLQQEASRRLRWGAQRTMRVAQGLYERGFITYMRTDSTTLSTAAVEAARAQVRELYGAEYVHEAPRTWAKKAKNAQEAHEAIRPSGDRFRTPAEVSGELQGDEFALYDLIWKRTVASQMADAKGRTATLRLSAVATDGRRAEFSASGTVITFRGFRAAYEETRDDDASADQSNEERRLPPLNEGDTVTAAVLTPEGHATSPPARYTEASLVKALEERGIGRPSTYASIMGTIIDRGYVNKKGSALVPTFLGFAVTRLLERHFAHLVDYTFTASMEDALDSIASGDAQMVEWLTRFYFGSDGEPGLRPLAANLGEIDARDISSMPVGDPALNAMLRVGRYGPYLERPNPDGGDPIRANVPVDLAPDELTPEKVQELFDAPSGERELGVHPEWGSPIVAKSGRYGPYVTEVLPEGAPKSAKPRTASLFADMSLDTVTLDDAVRLLSLPRVVGVDPADGVEITAQNGRYGPFLKKGTDSRSLTSEDQLFTLTLEEALAIYAQPKQRGRRAAQPPLRDLGVDPATGKQVVIKDGRFGPYITDGETNATVPRSSDPMTLSVDRAFDLLAERRAAGPAPKRAAKKAAPRKSATRTTAKKATKKSAKKATAKKSAAGRTATIDDEP